MLGLDAQESDGEMIWLVDVPLQTLRVAVM